MGDVECLNKTVFKGNRTRIQQIVVGNYFATLLIDLDWKVVTIEQWPHPRGRSLENVKQFAAMLDLIKIEMELIQATLLDGTYEKHIEQHYIDKL